MSDIPNITQMSKAIRDMAREAIQSLPENSLAAKIARDSIVRPIVYMRCAEFYAVLRALNITPEMRILDASSPQWFSIYLARSFPACQFHYCNIVDSELESYKLLSNQLGITNLEYHKEDLRNLSFSTDSFDKVISISVIEHVYPEQGGDYSALQEITRVLKPKGEVVLTIPYKDTKNIVYVNGKVHERDVSKKISMRENTTKRCSIN